VGITVMLYSYDTVVLTCSIVGCWRPSEGQPLSTSGRGQAYTGKGIGVTASTCRHNGSDVKTTSRCLPTTNPFVLSVGVF
jgi:hypothetical protein